MAGNTIKSKNGLSQTAASLKTEAANLEKIKESISSAVSNIASYEDVDFTAAASAIKTSIDLISNCLKVISQNLNNYLTTIENFDVNDFRDVDVKVKSTAAKIKTVDITNSYTSSTTTTTTSTAVKPSATATAVAAGATAAVSTTAATTTSSSSNSGTTMNVTATKGKTVEIPSSISQSGYTMTGYDQWIGSGKTMNWAQGTNQRKVSDIWKKQGSNFKTGIATVNVNGQERYLVATTTTFGKVGDMIDIKLKNGQVIPAIIADAKNPNDANCTTYGHKTGGQTNILEFEIQRSYYRSKGGNPTTKGWGLEWDSSSGVASITNKGSIL